MRQTWRGVLLVLLCFLFSAPAVLAQSQPPGRVFAGIESDWSEPDAPLPTFDPEAVDPDLSGEQELDDSAPYDEPVPKEALNQRLYVLDVEKEIVPCDSWLGEEYYGHGEMKIPQLFQYDFRQVICFYYGRPKSVATSGCGATSMSMIIAYLTGNKHQDPYTLFRWAVNNDLYEGSGLTHEALTEIGMLYGIGGTWVKPNEILIKAALSRGYPIIAHMGPGTFTNRGHYIVLRGLTEDGMILVNDPNSAPNSETAYAYADIVKQTKTEDPFFVTYKTEE